MPSQEHSSLESIVREIADEMRDKPERGEVATYIPELARVDAKAFGLVVIDAQGNVAAAGDCDAPFSIQGNSLLGQLALEKLSKPGLVDLRRVTYPRRPVRCDR